MFTDEEIMKHYMEAKSKDRYNEQVRSGIIFPVPQKIYDRIQKCMGK